MNTKQKKDFLKRIIAVCEDLMKARESLMNEAPDLELVNHAFIECHKLKVECKIILKEKSL